MNILRNSQHEGWVLAAYPDPKTSRPLIGAGFSLDVVATDHPQTDPLNPRLFFEPSSAQLWQAAGLDPERLQRILEEYDRNLQAWKKKNYRKRMKTHALPSQLTEDEATRLLRISAIQAIYNARAYCRNFDRLNSSQQMALSQLVFQMGVNLEEFVQFLAVLNSDADPQELAATKGAPMASEHWRAVQQALIDSQWARRYSTRAVSVIAMFDASYSEDPKSAEHRVRVVLRPPKHHRKKARVDSVRAESSGGGIQPVAHERAMAVQ